jgi:RHS repeat-associated protein
MTGSGIYYFGARFYSPKLGRFLSADTIVPGYGNPQNLNRYGYVRNNPLRYTDPSGHKPCGDGEDTDCGTGHKQDPNADPHPPKPPKPRKDNVVVLNVNYCDTHPWSCVNPGVPSIPNGYTPGADYCATHPGSCVVPGLPPITESSSRNPLYRVAEFGFGLVLVGIGAAVVAGGFFIFGAAVEEAVAGAVLTGPGEFLIAPHAVAVGTFALFVLIPLGGISIGAGISEMHEAITP